MSAHDQTMNGHGHGHEGHHHEEEAGSHATLGGYLTGFVLFVFLTAIPFWLVVANVFGRPSTTAMTILLIGAVQIVVYMILFLHMNAKSEGGQNMLSLIFALVLVVITLNGSLQVMYHLSINMMPHMQPAQTTPTVLSARTQQTQWACIRAPKIIATDDADDESIQIIGNGLNHFNDTHVGYDDRRSLAVLVRDSDSGDVVGGASGRTSLGLLPLDLFHLPETLRGMGIGTEALHKFEEEGRRRSCRPAVVYTINFQAPRFYERNGWVRFGEVPCDPPGTSHVFLSKAL